MERSQDKFTVILGWVIILLACYLFYLGGGWLYRKVVPQPTRSLAMSAWFDAPQSGASPQLRISGVVLENEKPVASGRVRITVEGWVKTFRQSLFVDVKDGRFDASDQACFRTLTPGDRLRIQAVYGDVIENVYLGMRAPMLTGTTQVLFALASVGLVLAFFWLFTGEPSAGKNHGAILFSYFIMIVFLGVPLALPYVISTKFPDVMETMKETPVGFLVAKPEQLEQQWVLNIGGSPMPAPMPAAEPAPAATATAPATTPTDAAPAQPAAAQPAVTQPETGGAALVKPAVKSPAPKDNSGIVVRGGLVIPLYVLILSIIGGAINMTRKLPGYQRDATSLLSPSSMMSTVQGAAHAVGALMFKVKPPEILAETQAEVEPPAAPEAEEGTTPEHVETPEEALLRRTAQWRQDLITQHMYLLSAPFLAIAVFYLLAWLDLLKQPALVLVSFSVGLISDKILGAILRVSGGIVERSAIGSDQSPTVPAGK